MPIKREDSRPERLLDVLRDPPIALPIKLTYGNRPRPTRDGKLLLVGRPPHECRRAVQPQEDEGRLPSGDAGVGVGQEVPDVGVAVVGASDDPVGVRSPVNTRYKLVVLLFRSESGRLRVASLAVSCRRTSVSVVVSSQPEALLE
jgi:hypothetical protein